LAQGTFHSICWLSGLALLASNPAQAGAPTNADSYRAGLQRLQGNQARIDHAMQRLGLPIAGDPITSFDSGIQDGKRTSLFQVHEALSQALISPGKLIFGKTLTRLIVGGDGSPALIQLDESQGFASGLRHMGTAKPSGTPGRLAIDVTRLLLRTGRAVTIQGTTLDTDGAQGLPAQVLSGKAWAVGGAMASSFISGLAASQQTETTNPFGFSQSQPTGRNALLQGVAQTAADQSKRLIDEATAEKPILIIEAETPVAILIQEEVRL
jgi:hypothetical protein